MQNVVHVCVGWINVIDYNNCLKQRRYL